MVDGPDFGVTARGEVWFQNDGTRPWLNVAAQVHDTIKQTPDVSAVQIIGGHMCTYVPYDVLACDHLEESMFPIETLAKEYVVAPPVQFPNNNAEKGQIVRVIASEPAIGPWQPVAAARPASAALNALACFCNEA